MIVKDREEIGILDFRFWILVEEIRDRKIEIQNLIKIDMPRSLKKDRLLT
jgi:hypothetical protein